jgi:Protein of unknown function (DUF2384)
MQTKAAKVRFAAPAATTASVHGLFRTSEPARIRVTIDDIACALGVSSRTVVRKEHDKDATLSPRAADRASAWIRTPNSYLGGETPVRMLDTEVGADAVTASLSVIAYGGVS